MNSHIRTEWEKILETLKKSIADATITTRETLEEGWSRKIKCEVDFPCCTYGQEWQHNVKDMMIVARSKIIVHYEKWYAKE